MRRCMRCMQEYEETLTECPHCGYSIEEQRTQKVRFPEALDAETILMGRYILGCLQTQDGFSNTYVAWDALLEKKVFLSEYYPSDLCRRIDGQAVPEPLRQFDGSIFEYGQNAFEEEAGRLNRNQDIDGLVPVFRCFRERGTAFAVSEYIYDDTLEEILEKESAIPREKADHLLGGLCRCIDEMHQRGICHWNLSLSDIYVDENWNGRLTGFGTAKILTAVKMNHTSLFSPYSAPELLEGNQADGRADLYSLGLIGKELYQQVKDMPFRQRSQIKKALNRLSAPNLKKRSTSCGELTRMLSDHYSL